MCDAAMHMEARRKTRILERQREAKERLMQQCSSENLPAPQEIPSQNLDCQENRSIHAEASRRRYVPAHMRDQVHAAIHPMEDRSAYYEYGRAKPPTVHAANRGVAYDRLCHDHSRDGPTHPVTWSSIERQLKHEAKVLRNNNLYMGHIKNFKELHQRGLLEPSQ